MYVEAVIGICIGLVSIIAYTMPSSRTQMEYMALVMAFAVFVP